MREREKESDYFLTYNCRHKEVVHFLSHDHNILLGLFVLHCENHGNLEKQQ